MAELQSFEICIQAIVFTLKTKTISRVYQHFILHSVLKYPNSPKTTGAKLLHAKQRASAWDENAQGIVTRPQ